MWLIADWLMNNFSAARDTLRSSMSNLNAWSRFRSKFLFVICHTDACSWVNHPQYGMKGLLAWICDADEFFERFHENYAVY